jgi:hypothetical protein
VLSFVIGVGSLRRSCAYWLHFCWHQGLATREINLRVHRPWLRNHECCDCPIDSCGAHLEAIRDEGLLNSLSHPRSETLGRLQNFGASLRYCQHALIRCPVKKHVVCMSKVFLTLDTYPPKVANTETSKFLARHIFKSRMNRTDPSIRKTNSLPRKDGRAHWRISLQTGLNGRIDQFS